MMSKSRNHEEDSGLITPEIRDHELNKSTLLPTEKLNGFGGTTFVSPRNPDIKESYEERLKSRIRVRQERRLKHQLKAVTPKSWMVNEVPFLDLQSLPSSAPFHNRKLSMDIRSRKVQTRDHMQRLARPSTNCVMKVLNGTTDDTSRTTPFADQSQIDATMDTSHN